MPVREQPSLNQQVVKKLQELMKKHGITQTALARAAQVRQQDVNRLFQGQMVYPPLEFLDALASVFKRRLVDLLRGSGPTIRLRDDELDVLAAWNGMKDQDARDALLRMMRGRPHPPKSA